MNDVINHLLSHRSIRSFQDKPVDEDQIDQIIQAVQAAPSWINGQQVTIIAVKEPQQRAKFAELCGGQKHVAEAPLFLILCADFYRSYLAAQMEKLPFGALDDIDTLLVGATDVGIALGTAVAAAESLGLGTVAIGGIRRNALKVIDELELPPYVFPVSGLCIGHPADDPGQKPRLPKEAIYHEEAYNQDLIPLLEQYNEVYSAYLAERSMTQRSGTWTNAVASFYSKPYYGGTAEMLKHQKFPVENE